MKKLIMMLTLGLACGALAVSVPRSSSVTSTSMVIAPDTLAYKSLAVAYSGASSDMYIRYDGRYFCAPDGAGALPPINVDGEQVTGGTTYWKIQPNRKTLTVTLTSGDPVYFGIGTSAEYGKGVGLMYVGQTITLTTGTEVQAVSKGTSTLSIQADVPVTPASEQEGFYPVFPPFRMEFKDGTTATEVLLKATRSNFLANEVTLEEPDGTLHVLYRGADVNSNVYYEESNRQEDGGWTISYYSSSYFRAQYYDAVARTTTTTVSFHGADDNQLYGINSDVSGGYKLHRGEVMVYMFESIGWPDGYVNGLIDTSARLYYIDYDIGMYRFLKPNTASLSLTTSSEPLYVEIYPSLSAANGNSFGEWMREDNEELSWAYILINDQGMELDALTGQPLWRPVSPIKWTKSQKEY